MLSIVYRATISTSPFKSIELLIKLQIQTTMDTKQDIKPPIAGSSKQPENDTENNTKNNIMTEHEMNNMLSRGVDPKQEIKETLTQFVRWRIKAYEQHKKGLSDIFAEDFQQFVREDFETLEKDAMYSLRLCLRVNGVYVRKGRGVVVSQALADVVQKDILWPEDDEERPPSKHPQQPSQQAQAPATAPVYPQQQ